MYSLSRFIDIKILFIIFIIAIIVSTFLCLFILLLIVFTKTLHSPNNLLLCNTSLALILYYIIATIKTSLLYNGSTYSTRWCRVLAYLDFVFLNMAYYSIVIQALSRLFLIVFHSHRHLLEYKFHIILIISQILISSLIPLPVLITEDVVFAPLQMCWIPPSKILHNIYWLVSTYCVPFFIIIIVYGVIYHRVIRSSTTIGQSSHVHKRDFKVVKNIVILLTIFLVAGIPVVAVVIVRMTTNFTDRVFYFSPLLIGPVVGIVERICLIYLNKELRRETIKLLVQLHIIHPSNRITVLAGPATYVTNAAIH